MRKRERAMRAVQAMKKKIEERLQMPNRLAAAFKNATVSRQVIEHIVMH